MPSASYSIRPSCRACPVGGKLSPDLITLLEQTRDRRRLRRGSVLFEQDQPVDSLFAVLEGTVVVGRRGTGGENVAIHLAIPGTTLGFRGLMNGGHHPVSARCGTNCLICRIPRPVAEAALDASRDLEGLFFHHLADELAEVQERMLEMTALGVRDRMVVLLGRLARHHATRLDKDGLRIALPVGRADMGALAGMTAETVSRCIRRLRAEDLAVFSRTHARIPSAARFADELLRLTGTSLDAG